MMVVLLVLYVGLVGDSFQQQNKKGTSLFLGLPDRFLLNNEIWQGKASECKMQQSSNF